MKRQLLILFTIALSLTAMAQPSAVQKAAKSVFTLTTYKADGTIQSTSHGVYFGDKGEGIAAFTPFIGATSAQIIDANGKKAEVSAIIGANEMYDICRFQLSTAIGTPLPPATNAAEGKVWSVAYSTKKPAIRPLNVASHEQFLNKYTYYIFKEDINEDEDGCPILNDAGELIGLVTRSSASYTIHSTDANFYNELQSTGFASKDRFLQKTGIRSALPTDLEQARLMLIMFNATTDSMAVENTINEFNKRFPTEIDGYHTLARYQMTHNNLDAVNNAMQAAIKRGADKAEAYARYGELIYNRAIYAPDTLAHFTLDDAENAINQAIAITDLPAYRHQLAQIVFAKGDYDRAYTLFQSIADTDIAGSELFYEMAQCKVQTNADDNEVLELLNQSVEKCPQPLTPVSAPYIYARGNWLEHMGENKRALFDYNTYDTLMLNRASADFYYVRYKCELKMKQYQQALNDIAHAAFLQPGEMTYLAELSSLNLRIGRYEDAVKTCDLGLSVTQEYSDFYIIRGVALAQLNRKEEALADFQNAKNLGDDRADSYIKKYSK